jgi:glyoxylase I family protein
MDQLFLHHVSLPTQNLSEAAKFFKDVLGFEQISRPAFPLAGAWLKAGGVEIHLVDFPQGSFRITKYIGTDDVHFAIRIGDFDSFIERLKLHGYRDDLGDSDNKRVIIKRKSIAGYSQLYIMDPDSHLIEINAAY